MSTREQNIERLTSTLFDVLIVGGGINGAVSAAALATRGVNVAIEYMATSEGCST